MRSNSTPVESEIARQGTEGTQNGGGWPSKTPNKSSRQRVVVIGAPEDVPRALQHPAVVRGRLEVAAVFAVDVDAAQDEGVGEALARVLGAHEAEAILVAGPVGPTTIQLVADLAILHHCELLAVMPTEYLAGHDPVIVWSGEAPLVQLARLPRRRWEATAKRSLDVVGAALALTVMSPLLLMLATLVRLESPGSPLFRHERIGYRGRRFRCLKLRTMREDAEECLRADPEMYEDYRRNHFKIPEDRDPRVTKLGRFLRRTSLDELPQFWNVLVGDMSLVGPRPVIDEELSRYGESANLLLSVRPGITGAWAVNGRHGVGYPDRCSIELGYVRNWNLALDARIAIKTFQVVAKSV